jgi:hypothetical protein
MEKSLQELMEEARAKAIEVGWVADPEPDDTPVVAPVEDPVDEFAGTDFANEQMVLPPPPESDLPEALRRRDAGMAQASSADRVQAWKAAAGAWLGGRSRDSEFTADDLVAAIGLPDPSDRGKNNVVGAWDQRDGSRREDRVDREASEERSSAGACESAAGLAGDVKRGGPLRRKTPLKAKPWKRKVPAEYRAVPGGGDGDLWPAEEADEAVAAESDQREEAGGAQVGCVALVKAGGLAFAEAIVGKRCVVCGRTAKEAFVADGLRPPGASRGGAELAAAAWDACAALGRPERGVCLRGALPSPAHRWCEDGSRSWRCPDSVIEFANEVGAEAHIVRTYASQ